MFLNQKIKGLKNQIVDIKLYTIMVSNLPENITSDEIKEFFE